MNSANSPLVSIIVPIYNVEKFLRKCLDSIVRQTYHNIEVVMVDDGSTDNSASIAKEYVDLYDNFKLIRQDNLGLGGARNSGIENSLGEYLLFPDSDDWLHESYVKRLIDKAILSNADVVECNSIQVWSNGRKRNRAYNHKVGKEISASEKEEYLRTVSYVVWNKIFKRSIIGNTRFPEHMTKQDYAWTPIILCRANKIVTVTDILYYYLWRSDSATNSSKANFNLLKAQDILSKSIELTSKHPDLLSVYFVRNIVGSLIWGLIDERSNFDKIEEILNDAELTYPCWGRWVKRKYVGKRKVFWAKLIYKRQYFFARLYVLIYRRLQHLRK